MIALIELRRTAETLRREAARLAVVAPMLAQRVAALAAETELTVQRKEQNPWMK